MKLLREEKDIATRAKELDDLLYMITLAPTQAITSLTDYARTELSFRTASDCSTRTERKRT